MNARSRSQAVQGLENLSFIISVHMVLVESFPDNDARQHWIGELNGFIKTLRRYNKATGKRKCNFTMELIELSLTEILEDNTMLEDIEDFIAAKGLPVENLDIQGSKVKVNRFADCVLTDNSYTGE